MSRYDQGAPGDEQFEPGSQGQVLRNRLGLTNLDEVNALEAALLAVAQDRSYLRLAADTAITVRLICNLHRNWLGPLYEFAGEIRTINLAKGYVRFAPVAYMEASLRQLDLVLAENTPCLGMKLNRLVSAIAQVHAELVLVHPFREGNGRLSRWIADLMSLQAGYPTLDWCFDRQTDIRREQYFAALRRAFAMDFNPLEALVKEALESAVRSGEDLRGES